MNQQELENTFYGEINDVQINKEIYQVQSVEFEDETFFLVTLSNQVICMIIKDEQDEWKPDCIISQELFEQIMMWINKLCLE